MLPRVAECCAFPLGRKPLSLFHFVTQRVKRWAVRGGMRRGSGRVATKKCRSFAKYLVRRRETEEGQLRFCLVHLRSKCLPLSSPDRNSRYFYWLLAKFPFVLSQPPALTCNIASVAVCGSTSYSSSSSSSSSLSSFWACLTQTGHSRSNHAHVSSNFHSAKESCQFEIYRLLSYCASHRIYL
jgi:hypothetical protein